MFDLEFEKTYKKALEISEIVNADKRLNVTQLVLCLMECEKIKKAITAMQLNYPKFLSDLKLSLNNNQNITEIPSANYPNLTYETERVIQRAIFSRQERKSKNHVSSLDVMLSILNEFNSDVTKNMIKLGLNKENMNSYILGYTEITKTVLDDYKDGKLIRRKRLRNKVIKMIPLYIVILVAMIYLASIITN
jgi:hypothetical protein